VLAELLRVFPRRQPVAAGAAREAGSKRIDGEDFVEVADVDVVRVYRRMRMRPCVTVRITGPASSTA